MTNCAEIAPNCAELRVVLNKINDIAIHLNTNILLEIFCHKINAIAIAQFTPPYGGRELRANPAIAGYCAIPPQAWGVVG